MTKKTIKVETVGVFPLVDPTNAQSIDSGGVREVIHTDWIDAQIAAGSLLDSEKAAEAADAEAAEANAVDKAATKAAGDQAKKPGR